MAYVDSYGGSGFDEPRPARPARPTSGFSYPNTGTTGYGQGGNPVPPVSSDPTTQTPPAPTPQSYKIQPVNEGKFNDPNHHSAKYDFLRTAQGFDPRQGIQQGLLDALNKFGYGNFSGSGQHMSISGITDAGRNAGLDPHDFSGDFIQHWGNGQNPDAQWAWDWYEQPQAVQQAAYGQDPMASALPFAFPPSLFPQQYAQQPQPQQTPAIFSDPAFWQQMMGAMQPQYAPGYSNASMPNFSGAQYGTSRGAPAQTNPQIQQLLSQLIAGLTGGR